MDSIREAFEAAQRKLETTDKLPYESDEALGIEKAQIDFNEDKWDEAREALRDKAEREEADYNDSDEAPFVRRNTFIE